MVCVGLGHLALGHDVQGPAQKPLPGRQEVGQAADHHLLELALLQGLADVAVVAVLADHRRGAGVRGHVGQVVGGVDGRDGHRQAAGLEHPQPGHHPLQGVGQIEHHPLSGGQPPGQEPGGHGIGEPLNIAVGIDGTQVDHGGLGGMFSGLLRKGGGDVGGAGH